MSDNIDKPQGGEADKPQGGTDGSVQGTGATLTPDLLQKIAELERDNKKYRDERKAQEAAAKKAQDEQLITQQKWQELSQSQAAELDKLKPIAEQYESLSAAFRAVVEAQLKDIPNDVRKSIVEPARETMDPVKFIGWLREFNKQFQPRQAPPLDGGAGSTRTPSGVNNLTPEQIEMARAGGVPLDVYAKRLAEIAERKRNPGRE